MAADINGVLDTIAGWTVLELSEFIKAAEEKFGVKAAASNRRILGFNQRGNERTKELLIWPM